MLWSCQSISNSQGVLTKSCVQLNTVYNTPLCSQSRQLPDILSIQSTPTLTSFNPKKNGSIKIALLLIRNWSLSFSIFVLCLRRSWRWPANKLLSIAWSLQKKRRKEQFNFHNDWFPKYNFLFCNLYEYQRYISKTKIKQGKCCTLPLADN